MAERRIDPDYDPTEAQVVEALRLLSSAARVPIQYKTNGDGNGFQKWILGVTASLVVVGVGGGIFMYGELAALKQQSVDTRAEVQEVKHEVADVKHLLTDGRRR